MSTGGVGDFRPIQGAPAEPKPAVSDSARLAKGVASGLAGVQSARPLSMLRASTLVRQAPIGRGSLTATRSLLRASQPEKKPILFKMATADQAKGHLKYSAAADYVFRGELAGKEKRSYTPNKSLSLKEGEQWSFCSPYKKGGAEASPSSLLPKEKLERFAELNENKELKSREGKLESDEDCRERMILKIELQDLMVAHKEEMVDSYQENFERAKEGLEAAGFKYNEGSNVYQDEKTGTQLTVLLDPQKKEVLVAFAGTGAGTKKMLKKQCRYNIKEFFGRETKVAKQAVQVGKAMREAFKGGEGEEPLKLTMVGHSRGGSLAQTAALAVGADAVVFNSKPLGKGEVRLAKGEKDGKTMQEHENKKFHILPRVSHSLHLGLRVGAASAAESLPPVTAPL